jgi:hypothetical protein
MASLPIQKFDERSGGARRRCLTLCQHDSLDSPDRIHEKLKKIERDESAIARIGNFFALRAAGIFEVESACPRSWHRNKFL